MRRGSATLCATMPSHARRTWPWRSSSLTTQRAVSDGTEKHSDCAPAMIAVLTPTTCARVSSSGPPELPGFRLASVWITPSMRRPLRARSVRPSADTTPVVTVCDSPCGLPMAITTWPTRSCFDSPSSRCCNGAGLPTRSSARSVSTSPPTRCAACSLPSSSVTVIASPASTTWLLVSR